MNIPHQYDVLWINAEPHADTEVGGHDPKAGNTFRPFVVCSVYPYNQTGSVVGLVVTHHRSSSQPDLDDALIPIDTVSHKVSGYIIPFGMYGYDYRARNGRVVDHLSKDTINIIRPVIKDIFGV